MALRRSGSGKPDTSSLHRIGSSCQDEDGAITAIDGWRRGSPGSVKVAHLLAATDMSTRETCRQQSRHLLEYLVRRCHAGLEGNRTSSLLPQYDSCHEVA